MEAGKDETASVLGTGLEYSFAKTACWKPSPSIDYSWDLKVYFHSSPSIVIIFRIDIDAEHAPVYAMNRMLRLFDFISLILTHRTVYVACDLGWRVFQLSISRSTTPDVIKMLSKLEEFFAQQLHSSVRAISSLTQSRSRPGSPVRSRAAVTKQQSQQPGAPGSVSWFNMLFLRGYL